MNARIWIGWVVTGLMAALMLLSAVPDVLQLPEAITVLKEWAFAGLTFDLLGALYSHLSVNDPPSAWLSAVVGLALMAASYLAYRTRPAPSSGLTT